MRAVLDAVWIVEEHPLVDVARRLLGNDMPREDVHVALAATGCERDDLVTLDHGGVSPIYEGEVDEQMASGTRDRPA
jgi:hypothetical protein